MKQKWKDGMAVGIISSILFFCVAFLFPCLHWNNWALTPVLLGTFVGNAFIVPLFKK